MNLTRFLLVVLQLQNQRSHILPLSRPLLQALLGVGIELTRLRFRNLCRLCCHLSFNQRFLLGLTRLVVHLFLTIVRKLFIPLTTILLLIIFLPFELCHLSLPEVSEFDLASELLLPLLSLPLNLQLPTLVDLALHFSLALFLSLKRISRLLLSLSNLFFKDFVFLVLYRG
jgi:hypothetical protein